MLGTPQANELLLKKNIDTPTLDYLKENNILIPQKKYDEATGTLVDGGEPITAPQSAYKIIEGSANDYTFEYKTYNEDGNVTSSYYKTELKFNPDDKYIIPDGYTLAPGRISDTLKSAKVTNVVFKDLTSNTYGGAIVNTKDNSNINIIADFINNSSHRGGAISNVGTICDITGNFINNSAYESGGVIYSSNGTIRNITGNFINNSASSSGGVIYNSKTIGNISGDFINNSTGGSGGTVSNNRGTIGDITGDFINNSAGTNGGAIQSSGTIGNITGNFINNSAGTNGGAIYNTKTIGDITGFFINNSSKQTGGAIHNSSTIGNITGDFINNSASINGGGIYNQIKTSIRDITGNFINNSAGLKGGAIHNGGTSGNITGNFINNSSDRGGAISNEGTVGNITGDFISNSVTSSDNYVQGGVIYNVGTIGAKDSEGNIVGGIINSTFLGNYAKTSSDNYYSLGGAIYTNKNINIIADDSDVLFAGNYTSDKRGIIPNAIFVRTNTETAVKEDVTLSDGSTKKLTTGYSSEDITPKITLNSVNGGTIQFDDQIDGGEIHSLVVVDKDAGTSTTTAQTIDRSHQYNLHLTGDDKSNIVLNNEVRNANISVDNVNVTVQKAQDLNFAQGEGINSLTMNSGTLNFLTLGTQATNFANLNMNGGTINIANSDLDLRAGTMGHLTANNYGENSGTQINVANLTVAKDMKNGVNDVQLKFADKSFAKNVNYTGSKDLYSKILKYHTWYNPSNGSFNVRRIGGVGGYNPAVLATSVAAQTGAYVSQTAAFNQAFSHVDGFMNNTSADRFALQHPNSYAINTNNLLYASNEITDKSMWVQPYASFESIGLKNGPKVNTTSYGTFVGGNGELKELSNGWSTVTTAYAGYNGSSQSYSGINIYQNGGMLGATQTWYKGNFYTALTANVGASVGEASTPYGHDNFTMLMAGVASKTGYNFEFKEGKFIVQPSMLIGYSFINTFDYTSAAGVKISQDPLNSIQLRPNVKFISNLKNGWQPYASVGVVWNVLNSTKATAEDITLPEMSIKPYVEYGVGVQKRWKDRFTGYAQAMLRNGGRNGIALTAGFKWSLGKEGKPIQKVQVDSKIGAGSRVGSNLGAGSKVGVGVSGERKVMKQLSPQQKMALSAKKNTTITCAKAVLKQL